MRGDITYKFKRQKRLLFLRRFFISGAVLAVSAAAAFYGTGRLFELNSVEISGNERVLANDLRSRIKQTLNQNPVFLWPNENIIFFDSERLAETLKKQFSAIDAVNISRDIWRKSLSVEIRERDPWAVWCKSICFYADSAGVLFERAPQFFGDLILKIADERPDDFGPGERIMDLTTIEGVQKLTSQIKKNNGVSLKSITIKTENELWLYTDGGFRIIIDSGTDFDRAYENFTIFLKSADKNKINKIEYIDLRFQDKTFYKLFPVF